MEYVIEEKPNTGLDKKITVSSSKDVFDLKEVQMIKNAIQEHLLFLGLDRGNNIRKISLLNSISKLFLIKYSLYCSKACFSSSLVCFNFPIAIKPYAFLVSFGYSINSIL